MVSNKIEISIIVIVIAIIGVFYISTIREGHYWGGDFSMYIYHAKNIAEGINYENTGYIYNPHFPSLAPKTYPPVFPLLLVPVYKLFGLNLKAMKIEVIIVFLIFLFMTFAIFRKELPFQYLFATIALIGFNPYFWNLKDNVQSDILFLVFVYLSLLFIHRTYQFYKQQRFQSIHAILVGVFIYLSYGTRSIGIVLIACLLIYEIIKFRKITQFSIMVILIFAFLMILQTIFLRFDSSYFNQFTINVKIIFDNLFYYAKCFTVPWGNGYSKIFGGFLFIFVCVLAFIGYIKRIKEGITIFEIFSFLYLCPIMIWPARQGTRFLLPVIPLYIFYAFIGIRKIIFFQQKKIEKFVFIILVVAIFISYVAKYTTLDFGPIREGVGRKETTELFEYIKENTNNDDIFIFIKPRVLSLFTERNASAYHRPHDDKSLWDYFHEIGASYVIVGPIDNAFLHLFVEKYKDKFEKVYSNFDFEVYAIKNALHSNGT